MEQSALRTWVWCPSDSVNPDLHQTLSQPLCTALKILSPHDISSYINGWNWWFPTIIKKLITQFTLHIVYTFIRWFFVYDWRLGSRIGQHWPNVHLLVAHKWSKWVVSALSVKQSFQFTSTVVHKLIALFSRNDYIWDHIGWPNSGPLLAKNYQKWSNLFSNHYMKNRQHPWCYTYWIFRNDSIQIINSSAQLQPGKYSSLARTCIWQTSDLKS